MQPEGFPLELKVGSAHVLNNSAEPQAFEVNLIFNLRLHFFDIFGIAGTQLHCAGQYTCKAGPLSKLVQTYQLFIAHICSEQNIQLHMV